MFSSQRQLDRRTGANGTGRQEYLQQLVVEFQDTDSQDAKEQVLANLANFAYDPINYGHLWNLNVVDLFLDQLSESNLNLVEYAVGGLCNLCLDDTNRNYILDNNGVSLLINCLSSANEEVVLSAITTLMFMITPNSKKDITTSSVIDCMLRFSESSNTRLKNVAQIFLEDYCSSDEIATVKQMNFTSCLGIPLPSDS